MLVFVLPGLLAGLYEAVGDHVDRRLQVEVLPLGGERPAVLDPVLAHGALDKVAGRGALRTEPAAGDWAVGVALYLGDLAVLDVDLLPAAYRAVRADGPRHAVRLRRAGPQIRLLL